MTRYTLSVWTKSSGSGAQLQVMNYGGTDKSAPIPSSAGWTNVVLNDITVTNRKADVSVSSTGQTVKVDDFTLIAAQN